MKLIAKKHLHLGDEYAKQKGLRVREIKAGEEFDIQDKEAPALITRGIAAKPEKIADEQAQEHEELVDAVGTEEAKAELSARAAAKKPAGK